MEQSNKGPSEKSRKGTLVNEHQENPTVEKKGGALINLRTMKDDVAEAIRRQHETKVSIAIAEEKKRVERIAAETAQAPKKSIVPQKKPFSRIMVVIIAIIIVAGITLAAFLIWPSLRSTLRSLSKITIFPSSDNTAQKTPLVRPKKLSPAMIPVQDEHVFSVDRNTVAEISKIGLAERLKEAPEGVIKNVIFENTGSATAGLHINVPAGQFLSFAKTPASDLLLRTLEPIFMAGLFSEQATSTPFFIIKVSDKDIGIAGMLDMETKLPMLFNNIFASTPFLTANPTRAKFRSTVIDNKDVRIAEFQGESVMYVFANPTTIIITQSKPALKKLLSLLPIAR